MADAICQEIGLRKDFFTESQPLDTLYLGGGTPSLLSGAELGRIVETAKTHFDFSPNIELTLEANPENLTRENLSHWAESGVNRLSIGIQSFRDEDLKWMNRAHTGTEAKENIWLAREMGISNLSLDLIFGIPDADISVWRDNLRQAIFLTPNHLSVYALTVEEKTALAHWVKTGSATIPKDEAFEAQFIMAHEMLTYAGFEHYEVSNYAREGFRSKHNGAYWRNEPYLGIGPSAHSFDGESRSWNVNNNARYMNMLSDEKLAVAATESLSLIERANEYIMTRLRCVEGIDLDFLRKKYEVDLAERYGDYLEGLFSKGLAVKKDDNMRLTPQGWLVSDAIIRELFWE